MAASYVLEMFGKESHLPLACAASIGAISAYCLSSVLNKQYGKPTNYSEKALRAKLANKKAAVSESEGNDESGELDLRRKCQISVQGPTDHAGEVVVTPTKDFDLNSTIFGSLEGYVSRTVVQSKIAVDLYWSDSAVLRIESMFARVPRAPKFNAAVVDFMHTDCDFAMEHADGSFMDHLKFCHDYCAINYKGVSPLVLFLHSIMGVGTNFFPMGKEKIPKLKSLLNEKEFHHVESFPSVLRLLLGTDLIERLGEGTGTLRNMKELVFHRVIDNEKIVLSREDLFVQLNYQLIHLLDFLPAASWLSQLDDGFLHCFIRLHGLLNTQGALNAKVNFDLKSGESTRDGLTLTLGTLLRSVAPNTLLHKLNIKSVQRFSEKIGHSLDYLIVM